MFEGRGKPVSGVGIEGARKTFETLERAAARELPAE